MKKSELISLRLKYEDLEYVNSLSDSYGRTTSEKIRNIIEESKVKSKSSHSFEDCYDFIEEGFSMSHTRLVASMRENGLRSEILDYFYEWLVHSSALYQSSGQEKVKLVKKEIIKLEEEVINELIFLADKLLGFGMSNNSRIINSSTYRSKIESIVTLAKSVDTYLKQKGSNNE